MFGFGKQPASVLVVREAEWLEEALTRALASADEAERPGLERAVELVARERDRADGEVTARWVRERLRDSGADPRTRPVQAIKALREAVPGLGLLSAKEMVEEAARYED
ncbi:hypothetical protein [Streptomyces sp. NPDC005438]|uniref:hypothetical protein n=1 Tax=Streptomyces sp. NPDC005438 TaxID=3156880 RepID=UPI00339DFB22